MKSNLITTALALVMSIGLSDNANAQLFGKRQKVIVEKGAVVNGSIQQNMVGGKNNHSCTSQCNHSCVATPHVDRMVCETRTLSAKPPVPKCTKERPCREEVEVREKIVYVPQEKVVTKYVPVPQYVPVPVQTPAPVSVQTQTFVNPGVIPQGCPPGSRTVSLGGTYTFIPPEQRPTYQCGVCGGTHPVGVYHRGDPNARPVVVQTAPRYVNIQTARSPQGYSQIQTAGQPVQQIPVQNQRPPMVYQSQSSNWSDSQSSSFHGSRGGPGGSHYSYGNNWDSSWGYQNSYQYQR